MFRAPTDDEACDKIAAITGPNSGGSAPHGSLKPFPWLRCRLNPTPVLVSLKAVDPAEYPFYGTAELDPPMPLQQALQGDSAVVADEFLIRLNAHVGGRVRLGGKNFVITAALKQEPDRISAGVGMGPRVMISNAALAGTGLLAPGSRASAACWSSCPQSRRAASQRMPRPRPCASAT